MGADQVGSADADPDAMGRRKSTHFQTVLRTTPHHVQRDDPVRNNASLVVYILQKMVQSREPLGQAGFQLAPLISRKNSGKRSRWG